MNRLELLADRFERCRARLTGVAYRLLGSVHEADDAVQEAWIRLSRSDTETVENLDGWLTTVVARVCLDALRSRRSRREQPLAVRPEQPAHRSEAGDPEAEAMMAETVGLAMVVVLQRLAPAERIAFVLHDLFDLSFDEIAPIVGRTPVAARQLASRARRRVRGEPDSRTGRGASSIGSDRAACGSHDPDAANVGSAAAHLDRVARQRQVVEAFLAAAREGDFEALIAA